MHREYWIHYVDNDSITMEQVSLVTMKKDWIKNMNSSELLQLVIERCENEKRNKDLEHAIEFLKGID